jgi:hypothetical protein
MIRHPHGSKWLLFTQHDHALLSGRLAEQIDGNVIARPSPQANQGIALHDCGWPLHDDNPTLNSRGEPLHVFETPVAIATQVWTASAKRAAEKDPYAGLLVSLHVLHLSAFAASNHRTPVESFEINKFQHQQIELQEQLRPKLGLRIDRPLKFGLAKPGTGPEEDRLLFDYHLLRAMDRLSLTLLCAEDLFPSLDEVYPRPGGAPIHIDVERLDEFSLRLRPWPFAAMRLSFSLNARRINAHPFSETEEFRRTYRNAPVESVQAALQA